MARALVIEESLERSLPGEWKERLIASSSHELGEMGNITIREYAFEDGEIVFASSVMMNCLKDSRYYAHIVSEETMMVCFPRIIVALTRTGPRSEFDRCRTIGNLFQIPADEMQFESMFDEDHPDRE